MNKQLHIFDLDKQQLSDLMRENGLSSYRAAQLLDWVYSRKTVALDAMTNLSRSDREKISQMLIFTTGRVVHHQRATDEVQKLLIQWETDLPSGAGVQSQLPSTSASRQLPLIDSGYDARRQTECVLIPSEDVAGESKAKRQTACVSTQIGCPVGCRFCASGLGGLDGNLTAGRIVEQVWRLGALPDVDRVSHVVFMGMGEPLSNFNELVKAILIITAPWGLGISARRVTVSTVGLPAQIRRLADVEVPVTLAISLHAPNDEIRRRLIPWAEYVTIDQLLEAGDYYFDKTGREITLEYILLGGVNDRPEHARELATVAKRLRANVNLIRYNEVKGLPFDRPGTDDVREFQRILRAARVNAHIRASRGRDIAAACGQLRHEQAKAS